MSDVAVQASVQADSTADSLAGIEVRPERPADAAAVDALVARAFGPGRFVKAVERLREGATPVAKVSAVAYLDGDLVGCVRQWAIEIGGRRALLLGPFAVEPALRSRGLGAALIRWSVEAAQKAGWPMILLVGDRPFFGPLGFSGEAVADIRIPGPVDPRRVLLRELIPGAAQGLAGPVTRPT